MVAQNAYLRRQLGESMQQKRNFEVPPHLDHPVLPEKKEEKRNPIPVVPQVKETLQGIP